jgi:hypothetical protein
MAPKDKQEQVWGLIDPPSPYATLQTWEQHLSEMEQLPDWAMEKEGAGQEGAPHDRREEAGRKDLAKRTCRYPRT